MFSSEVKTITLTANEKLQLGTLEDGIYVIKAPEKAMLYAGDKSIPIQYNAYLIMSGGLTEQTAVAEGKARFNKSYMCFTELYSHLGCVYYIGVFLAQFKEDTWEYSTSSGGSAVEYSNNKKTNIDENADAVSLGYGYPNVRAVINYVKEKETNIKTYVDTEIEETINTGLNAINAEATTRIEADNNLQSNIEAETLRATNAEAINAEAIADLQNEDININNKIAEEVRLREEAHLTIKEDCKKENDNIKILLGEETTRATNAETALQNAINAEAANREAAIKAAIEAIPEVDLSGYAKTEDIPTNVSELANDSGYLTEHQSLDDYATKKYVTDAIDAIPEVDLTGYAKESYVDTKVASLVDTAPEALNTLNELSAALGDDPNFATTVSNEIGKKVDKVEGKTLTTNDFTNEYKNKLDSVAENANNYTHPATHPASIITGLSTVATSGSYTDLTNTPEEYTHPATHPASMISGLHSIATSGSYNDLTNKPTIPEAYTHPTTHPASMITGLSTVATSGSYADLSNKPTIPSAYTHPSTHPASMITGLATVATSGSYNDLSNKPTVVIGDKTYTIKTATSAPASSTSSSIITFVTG